MLYDASGGAAELRVEKIKTPARKEDRGRAGEVERAIACMREPLDLLKSVLQPHADANGDFWFNRQLHERVEGKRRAALKPGWETVRLHGDVTVVREDWPVDRLLRWVECRGAYRRPKPGESLGEHRQRRPARRSGRRAEEPLPKRPTP